MSLEVPQYMIDKAMEEIAGREQIVDVQTDTDITKLVYCLGDTYRENKLSPAGAGAILSTLVIFTLELWATKQEKAEVIKQLMLGMDRGYDGERN